MELVLEPRGDQPDHAGMPARVRRDDHRRAATLTDLGCRLGKAQWTSSASIGAKEIQAALTMGAGMTGLRNLAAVIENMDYYE